MSVVPLLDARDQRKYGGKASALARLASYGLPVPDGFCISGVSAAHLTPSVLEKIGDHLQRLSTTHVAVRSSASLEDGQGSSFAGIFQSELDVPVAVADVSDAIGKVVGSLSSAALLPYLSRLGIKAMPEMAVIIQVMLRPEMTGVLFTWDPVTERPNFLIEASSNHDVNVEAGRGSPLRVVVERRKPMDFELGSAGTVVAGFDDLGARHTHALIASALQCEEILGGAQDIEWALQGDSIWILQSRPITGLPRCSND